METFFSAAAKKLSSQVINPGYSRRFLLADLKRALDSLPHLPEGEKEKMFSVAQFFPKSTIRNLTDTLIRQKIRRLEKQLQK